MSAIILAGCDFSSRYSENTPVKGANWERKASAKASPAELTEMARAVLAQTPDSDMNDIGKPDASINWPRNPPEITSGPNTWQISLFTSTVDAEHSELRVFAKFLYPTKKNIIEETPPTPEAKERLNAILNRLLQAGGKLQLSVTVNLHEL